MWKSATQAVSRQRHNKDDTRTRTHTHAHTHTLYSVVVGVCGREALVQQIELLLGGRALKQPVTPFSSTRLSVFASHSGFGHLEAQILRELPQSGFAQITVGTCFVVIKCSTSGSA